MDNAMVKRGIGAVVLAIIAALLLGYLLKDKSDQRQDIVEMELPGAPDMNIPSLSEKTDDQEKPVSLVDEVNNTAKIDTDAASKTKTLDDALRDAITDNTSVAESAVTQSAENATSSSQGNNPGFSFRPPSQNEEQQINTDTANSDKDATVEANNTVIASNTDTSNNSSPTNEEKFKPIIENEPKKKAAKTVIKNVAKKQVTKAKPSTPKTNSSNASASSDKYTIQLLATSSQSRANKLAKTMSSEGYVSFITQTTSNNKVLYRVRVGGFKNRSAAIKAQQGMKRRYQKNFSVQNSLVVAQ